MRAQIASESHNGGVAPSLRRDPTEDERRVSPRDSGQFRRMRMNMHSKRFTMIVLAVITLAAPFMTGCFDLVL